MTVSTWRPSKASLFAEDGRLVIFESVTTRFFGLTDADWLVNIDRSENKIISDPKVCIELILPERGRMMDVAAGYPLRKGCTRDEEIIFDTIRRTPSRSRSG